MAVRNCREIGENLQLIMNRLLANDNLVRLLYYTDKDPLSQPALTAEQKQKEVFEKLIKIVPKVGTKETAHSIVTIRVVSGHENSGNTEFRTVNINIEVFVPLTQWIFKNTNLRPFAILGEIQESLNNKVINGIGKMHGGDFDLSFITDEIACYDQSFVITAYD